MLHRISSLFLLSATLLLATAAPSFGSPASDEDELDPVHHSADAYYLDFSPFPKVELPRIFLVRRADGGLALDVFGSTKSALAGCAYLAEYEEAGAVEAAGEHAQASEGDHASPEAAAAAEHQSECTDVAADTGKEYLYAHLVPAGGGHVLVDFSISRHLVFAWLGALLIALLFISMARRYTRGVGRDEAPKGLLQNTAETLVMFVRDEIARPNLGPKADRYLPYLLTVFFFILTCNLLGLVPFGATATSNISVTAVLAIFTFLLTQFGGTKHHWAHIFNPPGVPAFVRPILVPVEILGLFTKPFALAIRLFANMTAGHLVILSLIGLIFTFGNLFGPAAGYGVAPVSIAFALFIYVLELLVSCIQAYVFTMLSALFIGMAVEEHEHDHDHSHSAPLEAHAPAGELIEVPRNESELATVAG